MAPSLSLYFSLFLSLSCFLSFLIYAFGENDSGSSQDRRKSTKFCYPAHPPAVTHLVGTPVWWAETNFPTYPPHQLINKFAKLRRCASRVSFGSQKVCAQLTNSLTKLDFYVDVDVGHHVGHLVYLHVGHHVQLHIGHIFFYSGKA